MIDFDLLISSYRVFDCVTRVHMGRHGAIPLTLRFQGLLRHENSYRFCGLDVGFPCSVPDKQNTSEKSGQCTYSTIPLSTFGASFGNLSRPFSAVRLIHQIPTIIPFDTPVNSFSQRERVARLSISLLFSIGQRHQGI